MHVHVPSGAIPKDGPSAGVTMATAMASELTGRPVRGDIAMTGEITLSGRVLPVGGIKEKVLAARRVGIREVILPKQNAKNVNEDLTPELRQDLTVHLVSTIDEVLALALQPVVVGRAARAEATAKTIRTGRQAGTVQVPPCRRRKLAGRQTVRRTFVPLLIVQSSTRPVSHRYRAARLSHRQVPAGLQRLLEPGVIRPSDVVEPEPAAWDELALVHTARVPRADARRRRCRRGGRAARAAVVAEMVEGFRLMVGGTIRPPRACALRSRSTSAHVPDSTSAVSYRRRAAPRVSESRRRLLSVQRRRGRGPRAAGARRRADRDRRSRRAPRQRHGLHLRVRSARLHVLDAPAAQLPDVEAARLARHRAAGRRATMHAICASSKDALPTVDGQRPECVFYLAGADPYEDDQLGGLRLTKDGLRRRDRMVIDAVPDAGDAAGRSRWPAATRGASRTRCRDPRRDDRGSVRRTWFGNSRLRQTASGA